MPGRSRDDFCSTPHAYRENDYIRVLTTKLATHIFISLNKFSGSCSRVNCGDVLTPSLSCDILLISPPKMSVKGGTMIRGCVISLEIFALKIDHNLLACARRFEVKCTELYTVTV